MLFKSIEIYNFGRYAGRNLFDTTVTDDRNVILVKAKNDRGKTTLFQAIKFALYGDDGLRPKPTSEWINLQKASEGDGEMYAEIKFKNDGDEYRLKRLIKFRKTQKGEDITTVGNPTIDLFRDDNPFMARDSDPIKKSWIDTILPKDASQFFFFDGEEIQRYIRHEETHVKQAIERVLGIKELLNAKDDLVPIFERFQTEYDKNVKKHGIDEKSKKELERINQDLSTTRSDIAAEQTFFNGAEAEKTSLEKEQKKYEEIKSIVEERDKADTELINQKKILEDSKKNLSFARGNTSLVLLSPLLEIINKTEEDPPSVDRWQSETIKYILKNMNKCVCDRNIDQHIQEIFNSKILDITPSKTSILKKFVNHMLIEHEPAAKCVSLLDSLENASNIIQNIDKQKSTLNYLNQHIRDASIAQSIKELQEKYDEVVKDMGLSEKKLLYLKDSEKKLEHQKKTIESRINSSVVNKQLVLSKQRKETCQTIADCITKSIERFYEKRKPDLERYITQIFMSIINNPDMYRGLKIDRDFSMKVIRDDGTELPTYKYSPSAGASQIVATSMIGGLNKFATRDAPVVIDTPMGRLDTDHRKNMMSYYSRMSKQIIILYQPSELNDEDIQSISDHLASEWVIDSQPGHPDLSRIQKERSYL